MYRSSQIGVAEMLDALIAAGRNAAQAGRELDQAIAEGAISLWAQLGSWSGDTVAFQARAMIAGFVRLDHSLAAAEAARFVQDNQVTTSRAAFEQACGLADDSVAALPSPHTRYMRDDDLVLEATAGLQSKPPRWPNVNQASMDLASRAEGTATIDSKAKRLRDKISKVLQTSPNISKD